LNAIAQSGKHGKIPSAFYHIATERKWERAHEAALGAGNGARSRDRSCLYKYFMAPRTFCFASNALSFSHRIHVSIQKLTARFPRFLKWSSLFIDALLDQSIDSYLIFKPYNCPKQRVIRIYQPFPCVFYRKIARRV
jgi:hypothetical protein